MTYRRGPLLAPPCWWPVLLAYAVTTAVAVVLIDLDRRFGTSVAAEGVESREEREALRPMDGGLVQGCLARTPVPFAGTRGHGSRRRGRTAGTTGRAV